MMLKDPILALTLDFSLLILQIRILAWVHYLAWLR